MATTTLTELQNEQNNSLSVSMINMPDEFNMVTRFEFIQRAGKLYATSTIVPKEYQNSVANCAVAVDMALEMKMSPIEVMRNLYLINGRPSWSTQYLIAQFNLKKGQQFSFIDYEFEGDKNTDSFGCRAFVTELKTGRKLTGTLITLKLAKAEGWFQKNGSKWQTMPDQMLRYRSAAWLIRAYFPEVAYGLLTQEEVQDGVTLEMAQDKQGTYSVAPQGTETPKQESVKTGPTGSYAHIRNLLEKAKLEKDLKSAMDIANATITDAQQLEELSEIYSIRLEKIKGPKKDI